MKTRNPKRKRESANGRCLQQLVRRLYEDRLAAGLAHEALKQKASVVGRCEMDSENGMRCYLSPDLPAEEWCGACQAKKPLWEDYHKKSNMAGAALRMVLQHAQTLPPNETKLSHGGGES
jgi:hypothetical protein